MTKTCRELFQNQNAKIIGDEGKVVSGLTYKSNDAKSGDAFFCIVGQNSDGHSFALDAVANGANVIVAEREMPEVLGLGATCVIVDDTRKSMAMSAAEFYDHPSRSMMLVGITGTNGKTTTTFLTEEIGKHIGLKTAVIGTVGVKIGDEIIEDSGRTTPESLDLQRILASMRDKGCKLVVMEVSSHALDLKRVWGCNFAVTAFTNLSQDHLDYHKTFEDYFEAKCLLFSDLYPAKRVIGTSGEWGVRLAKLCIQKDASTTLTYGFNNTDNIFASDIKFSSTETIFDLSLYTDDTRQTYNANIPLVGKFNIENAMCAFGIAVQLGFDPKKSLEALREKCNVPGRLERVSAQKSCNSTTELPKVFVDYAHTPDALEKAISTLRELTDGKLYVLFGCGGDRDSAKRPLMGAISLNADFAVVTSDNPRTEDPLKIIADILEGMKDAPQDSFAVVEDRASAIEHIIKLASGNDIVLLAGKGHEDYQEGINGKIHFDDREFARKVLEELECD